MYFLFRYVDIWTVAFGHIKKYFSIIEQNVSQHIRPATIKLIYHCKIL